VRRTRHFTGKFANSNPGIDGHSNENAGVDDCEAPAKRGFSFITLLFALANAGEQQNLPFIIIPAQ